MERSKRFLIDTYSEDEYCIDGLYGGCFEYYILKIKTFYKNCFGKVKWVYVETPIIESLSFKGTQKELEELLISRYIAYRENTRTSRNIKRLIKIRNE